MTPGQRAPDPQSISPGARVWTRFVAEQIFLEGLVKDLVAETWWLGFTRGLGFSRQPAENTSP